MFPEHTWYEWKFKQVPDGFWNDKNNQKKYTEWLGKKKGYEKLDDWYQISYKNIYDNHGSGLLKNYYNGSPKQFIISMFPEHNWNICKFAKHYSKGEIEWLEYMKIERYPDIVHILNNNNEQYKIPNTYYLADGYSKSNNTILEYHGDFWHGNPKIYNQNDINPKCNKTYGELYKNTIKKKEICEKIGYNYISIWESDWFTAKNVIIKRQKLFKNNKL